MQGDEIGSDSRGGRATSHKVVSEGPRRELRPTSDTGAPPTATSTSDNGPWCPGSLV